MFEELRYDTEAVDSTAHEGVFVNKMDEINYKKFDQHLENLRKYSLLEDVDKTIEEIFSIVPSKYRKENKS